MTSSRHAPASATRYARKVTARQIANDRINFCVLRMSLFIDATAQSPYPKEDKCYVRRLTSMRLARSPTVEPAIGNKECCSLARLCRTWVDLNEKDCGNPSLHFYLDFKGLRLGICALNQREKGHGWRPGTS